MPVLIVGAGPTGLSLACALVQLGIPIRIIELKSGLSEASKATNLMQGTLERLAIFKLVEPMIEISDKMSRMIMEGYGAQLGARTMHLDESPFPDVLLLGQDNIEKSLSQSLKNLGMDIEFSTQLVHLVQEGNLVKVGLRRNTNSPSRLRGKEVYIGSEYKDQIGSKNPIPFQLSDLDFLDEKALQTQTSSGDLEESYFSYVVACDGPWGLTRSFTSCNFTPIKTGRSIRQVDAHLDWKRLSSMKQMWLFYFSKGFMVVVPLLEGYYRILSIEPTNNIPNRKPTMEEMQDKLREVSGDHTLKLSQAKWFSHTELNMGIAPKLIDNRVILAGDASNPILPNGGQGLNTGIQDSINLAWKLAEVLKGDAKTSLLDTYEEERLSLRIALEKVQFNSLKYTTTPPGIMQWIISKFGNVLLDKWEMPMAKAFSELGVDYKNSSLSKNGKLKKKRKGLLAGNRILDANIRDAYTGHEVSLFYELSVPLWKILVFDGNAPLDSSFFEFLKEFHIPGLKTLILNASLEANYLPFLEDSLKVYYDIDLLAHKRYGIDRPNIILVRPDNFIAFRTEIMNGKELESYRNSWFN